MQAHLSDPTDPETFACSKLDLSERQHHAQMYALHRDLLRCDRRSGIPVPAPWWYGWGGLAETFVLRFFGHMGTIACW